MNILEDKINGIIWYNAKRCLDDNYMAEDKIICDEVVQEMNTWMNPNIERFITDENLGTFMLEESWGRGYEDFFFGLVDGKLATTLILANNHGFPVSSLIDHMFIASKLDDRVLESKKVLSFEDTRRLVDNNRANIPSLYVNFLVVNPDMQGRGIGTKSLKSLDDFRLFFVGDKEYNSMYATINQNNIASRKAFERNGYLGILRKDADEPRQYPFDDYFKVM